MTENLNPGPHTFETDDALEGNVDPAKQNLLESLGNVGMHDGGDEKPHFER